MKLLTGQVVVAWLALAAVAILYGSAVFALLACSPASTAAPGQATARRALAKLWRVLATLAVALVPLGFLIATSNATGASLGEAMELVTTTVRDSREGRLWCARVVLTLALFSAAWVPSQSRLRDGAIGVMGALWIVARALVSHSVDSGALAVTIYAAHMLAAALWLGAMVAFSLGASQTMEEPAWSVAAVRQLWRVAEWCAVIVALTGVLIVYGVTRLIPADLIYSRYGRVLGAKVALFAVVIAYGIYIRLRLARKATEQAGHYELVRAIGVEAILLIGIIEFAALLAHSRLPH
jgi:putative copper export protein